MADNLLKILDSDIIADEYKTIIKEIVEQGRAETNAELILRLCQIIMDKIDIVQQSHYFHYSKQRGFLYKKGKNAKINNDEEQRLMVFSAQLIYLLRTFIHNEEITFHMASRTQDGKYQASAFVPQSEILRSLSAVSKKDVGVSAVLQAYLSGQHQNDTLFEIKRKNMWTQVEYLANPIIGRNSNKIDVRKPGAKDPHWAYQSLKNDIMVYIAFHKNKTYTKYYDMDGKGQRDSLLSFNNGWLWEWYNKILYGGSDEEYLETTKSLMHGSLRPIMIGPDYIPGTKEGDFQDLQNRQIQSKYGNTKIISYNNIRHIIYDLTLSLTQYIQEEKQSDKQLMDVLQEHFFPESAKIGNKFANETADNLLKKLNAKI